LVQKVAGSTRQAPSHLLRGHFPVEAQKTLSQNAARLFGFDFEAGRLDTTLHPFCTGITPGDTRITTRYDERDFGNCFFSVLHETGHALYDQGLPAEQWGTPLGEAVSLGIHESQSRLWENLVGRGEPFWRFYLSQAKAAFPAALGDVPTDDFLFAVNEIRPSLIRTEADEATYNLHVLIRFELEQLLLSGQLPVEQLPETWNRMMRDYLGVEVPDDRRGCLQDVHWSEGMFGYFPTYTLGNLNAAAFFVQARKDLGDLDGHLAKGDFAPLLDWLRKNVHQQGMRYTASELLERITGEPLSIEPLLTHLGQKVDRFYGL
jgi:carboxypeptidase Taq